MSDLDSLHTHHPKRNFSAVLEDGVPRGAENVLTRSYAVVGGEFQEVLDRRVDKYRSLQPDQVLLIKDFILDDMSARDTRRVDVPSPLAGVIGRVDAANGVVDIHETADGPPVARIRHLGPIAVQPGDTVAYGQSLGTQNNIGLGASAGKHVHIEIDTRYYQQFEHYLLDLVEGRLAVQAAHRAGVEPRAVVDDGVQRVGESGERVAAVQRALVAAGYRGAGDTPIAVDGVYRLSMQGAVLRFQQEHGLPASGDVDAPTWRAALDLTPGRRALPPPVADELPPALSPAHRGLLDRIRGRLGQLDAPSGLSDCDRERVAGALLRLAVEHRLSSVDHVLVGDARPGGNQARVFLVQGRLDDPAQRRAWMPMADALGPPVEDALVRSRRPEHTVSGRDMDMPAQTHTQAAEPSHGTAPRAMA
ncbi:peptidoglycan-binding domain-containing protein [Luteimonas sp. MC1750]|uniref:XVIPCD domain-containing protein n=1 Tax=Luteimonas sp. MC1750 TaxID=2799326 RepID=UPI0018F0E831|nr:peptidoglycan-binding protein [Luteimonas sp. MC1750]